MHIQDQISTDGKFYILTDKQYDYAFSTGIFSSTDTRNNATINSKPFTIKKSGEKRILFSKEYYYLDDIKVLEC
jgi:RNA binding exosome subunit